MRETSSCTEHLRAARRAAAAFAPATAALVAAVAALSNAVLLRSHARERCDVGGAESDDDDDDDGPGDDFLGARSVAAVRAATDNIASSLAAAQDRLSALFSLYLDLQSALQSAANAHDMDGRRRQRAAELGGELLAMHAGDLSLAQAVVASITPLGVRGGSGIGSGGGRSCGGSLCDANVGETWPPSLPCASTAAGLPRCAEDDRERLMVAASTIAVRTFVDAARVEDLFGALESCWTLERAAVQGIGAPAASQRKSARGV